MAEKNSKNTGKTKMETINSLQPVGIIAQIFDRSSRHIQSLTSSGVLPTVGSGNQTRYELLPTVQRYVQYLYKQIDKKTKTGAEQRKDEADAKYKEAKAEKAELELKEMQAQMHRSEDVEAMTDDLIWTIRGIMLALPGRVAVDAANANTAAEVSDIIKKECFRALDEISRYQYDSEKYMERVRARTGLELSKEDERTDEGSGQKIKQSNRAGNGSRKTAGRSDGK